MEITNCSECYSTDLEEHDDYIKCNDCGAQFEVDSDPDDPTLYEEGTGDE